MTREEAIQFIKDEMFVGENKVNELCEAVERLEQPITLAELLGWEENQEYEFRDYHYKVSGDCLYYKESKSDRWTTSNELLRRYKLLRDEATEVEEPKYYAKIKGWELAEGNIKYWNYTRFDNCLYLNTNSHNGSYETIFTKSEWAKLGINDTNADFEEVRE